MPMHAKDSGLADFIQQRNDQNCFRLKFGDEIVQYVLSMMNLSKGSGYDGISSLFLRECAVF